MRTYERTHSRINFKLDLRQASYKIWLLLGEAQSKCYHIIGAPLLPDVAEELHQIYLAKGILATTAIEGNSLTEDEVQQHLAGKLKLPPSKEYLQQEITNVAKAYTEVGQQTLKGKPTDLYVQDLKDYNRLILNNLPVAENVIPGQLRNYEVWVGGYKGAPHEDCAYLLEIYCKWLNDFHTDETYKLAFGIVKAIAAHLYFAWIHPFGDGNGRTARLVEFQILLVSGLPSTAAHLLSNHYNQTRSKYYLMLDRAYRAADGIWAFIEYSLEGLVDALKLQIEVIQVQQMRVHLINYIHDIFKGENSKSDIRRRHLALDLLADGDDPVPAQKIRHISARMAEHYATKTEKTVRRDLNILEQLGILVKEDSGYRIKVEILRGFLPRAN